MSVNFENPRKSRGKLEKIEFGRRKVVDASQPDARLSVASGHCFILLSSLVFKSGKM